MTSTKRHRVLIIHIFIVSFNYGLDYFLRKYNEADNEPYRLGWNPWTVSSEDNFKLKIYDTVEIIFTQF